MAVPKKRTSRSKRNMRRSHHALTKSNPGACPKCGNSVLPHRVCGDCGEYRGRSILVKEID